MKKILFMSVLALLVGGLASTGFAEKSAPAQGKALFEKNCASCHPSGGNIINPQKTLHKASLAAHNVTTAKDIINLMRNPGPGMTKFDKQTIPDKDAKSIADYVLKTFK